MGKRAPNPMPDQTSPCEACGLYKPLYVHHIDGDPLNNEIDNLETRCRDCAGKSIAAMRTDAE